MSNLIISFFVNSCIAKFFFALFGAFLLFPAPITRELLSVFGVVSSDNDIINIWSFGTILFFGIIAQVPAVQKVICIFYGWRMPQPEELSTIEAALSPVYENSQYNPGDFILKVKDDPSINAAAFGHRIIVINTGTLQLPLEEISGILAHESGHITHKDSRNLISAFGMDVAGQFMMKCIMLVHHACAFLTRLRIPLVSSFLAWVTWFFFFLELIIGVALSIPHFFASQFLSRRCEYGADQYACEIGLGQELYAALLRLSQGESRMTWWQRIRSNHPVTERRLERIRSYLEVHPDK